MLDLKKVCERALQEGVGPGERAWAWRLLLGVIPASGEAGAVEASLKASRLRYEKLRREHLPDISSSCEEAGDPLTMALGAESGWSRFYASADLRAEIQKDLDRLVISGLPEDHFSRSSFWASMLTVLTVWSTAHPDIGYRQGMHEILALVVLALEDEIAYGCGPAEGDDEADCFSLFEAIMVRHADHFHAGPEAPVVAACRTAQAELLELYEPRLARRLNDYVEPQIYGLRWARLLFSREFEAPASLTLCDALFAAAVGDGDPLAFRRTLQIFFVALLLVCAPRLMAATDEMECLSVLMRPQQCSVLDVVSLARRLIEAQSQTRLANDTIVASVDDRGLPHFTTPLFGGEGGGNADDDSANGSPRAPAVISANDDDDDDDDEALANGLDSALGVLSKYANTPEAVAALDKIKFVADRLRVASV
ncbi:hypothetical protein CTAYLR_002399 [Chrysophaeum taylorii]|uniref:Rab-GAP TBC domain-containing protein n=1 Tax=Chrysophaeum taylorii TaxID=2483200 RepID=A0AAD7XM19_9STRA|nr:hypothetical protein CTAYLR_002399 [Chrysophaeum taylorii]